MFYLLGAYSLWGESNMIKYITANSKFLRDHVKQGRCMEECVRERPNHSGHYNKAMEKPRNWTSKGTEFLVETKQVQSPQKES